MSLQIRLGNLITAIGTDYKTIKTMITGSSAGDLTGLTTTAKGNLVAAINEVKAGNAGSPPTASEIVSGIAELATQLETNAGTDDLRIVTPLKFQTRLAAYAQPLAANLTSLAGVTSTAFGQARLSDANAAAAKSALGLSAVATSGSASDITTGTLPTSVMPPLAINEVFTAVSQVAMLALIAQRGDVVIRTDLGSKMFILASDSPGTLADWKQIVAAGDVTSVASRTGAITLTSADVGLGSVDNTSDLAKPVSTAGAAADALDLKIAANLSDLNNFASARTNLAVYSQAEMGAPETDLVALYTSAKV